MPKNLFLLTPAKTASLPLLSRFTASRSIRKFRYLEPLGDKTKAVIKAPKLIEALKFSAAAKESLTRFSYRPDHFQGLPDIVGNTLVISGFKQILGY